MAKLSRYIKLEPDPNPTLKPTISYKMTLKRWGIPILVYKCLKENFELKWYQWLLYPYLCCKVMR